MKRKYITFSALALLIIALTLTTAFAYFTTNTEASGGYPISLGGSTEVYERFQNWTKHVSVYSDEGSQPVFVRARAFWGSEYNGEYSGESWHDGGDGYWYCNDILYGGEQTAELSIKLSGIPDSALEGDSFTVVVVYETTPVLYGEDGAPYADWNVTLDSGTVEGGIG